MSKITDAMVGKKVRVTCTDGDVIVGKMTDWTSAYDNDPKPESINLDNYLEIYIDEIEKVEIIR